MFLEWCVVRTRTLRNYTRPVLRLVRKKSRCQRHKTLVTRWSSTNLPCASLFRSVRRDGWSNLGARRGGLLGVSCVGWWRHYTCKLDVVVKDEVLCNVQSIRQGRLPWRWQLRISWWPMILSSQIHAKTGRILIHLSRVCGRLVYGQVHQRYRWSLPRVM
jgi:hypothetical protein